VTARPPLHHRDRRWTVVIGLVVLVAAVHLLIPAYIDNEPTYVLGPIKILHPGFLAGHPFVERWSPYFVVFDSVVSPFYLTDNWLAVTLVLRVAIWVFQAWALTKLCRTLGLAPWTVVVMVVSWLAVEQTLAAGEWVFGCMSAKPVGYGFVFLGLDAVLRRRFAAAGVYAGLAACFHILVGGWSVLALGAATLVQGGRGGRLRALAAYAIPAALVGAVGLAPAGLAILLHSPGDPAAVAEATRVNVLWVNPFHLDPEYFLTAPEYLKLVLYLIGTLALLWRVLPRPQANAVIAFLGVVGGVFAVGLVARKVDAFWFLKYYPFRVADGMYPMFFWLGAALLLQRFARRIGGWGGAGIVVVAALFVPPALRWVNNGPLEDPAHRVRVSAASVLAHPSLRGLGSEARARLLEWRSLLRGQARAEERRMAAWIRENTPPDAVFIIPPRAYPFPLEARRIEFISFKTFTIDKIRDWRDRFEALNGGPFHTRGREIVTELSEHYDAFTPERVAAIRRRYRVDYILIEADGLGALPLMHSEGRLRLYRIPPPEDSGGRPK
jgi:hypothetical protein